MPSLGSFHVAQVEQSDDPFTFEFCGVTFTVSTKIGVVPLADFLEAAESGLDDATQEGIVAIKNLVSDCVIDSERGKFLQLARVNRANGDDLMPIARAVWEALSARPTVQPSDSSDGSSTTTTNSKAPSSSAESSLPGWWDSAVAVRERAVNPDFGKDFLTTREHGKALVGASN